MSEEKLLIIGNGFDLDLGFKTKYKDFIESDYFKSERLFRPLFNYLWDRSQNADWVDIEMFLHDYALNYGKEKVIMDEAERDFNFLRVSLCKYLRNAITYIKKDSIAANLLLNVLYNECFGIISFNYTNLNNIANSLGYNNPIKYTHVHGTLEKESIILGFHDGVNVNRNAYFMIKSHSEFYESHNIREKLENAEEVIFFGHSLGLTDYHYFKDFFQKQSGLSGSDVLRKKIRIFTFDETSRKNILSQLREMNEKRVDYLYDLNDFKVFRTSCSRDLPFIEDYFKELRESSMKNWKMYIDLT